MTVAVSIGLLLCQWFGPGEGLIPSELYPAGWPARQYPTVLHKAIVDGVSSNEIPDGLMIAHDTLTTAFGVLLASSNGSTADEIAEAMTVLSKVTGIANTELSHLKPVSDKFKESSYTGVYVPPQLYIRADYADKIRDMGVDLVPSLPNSTIESLSDKLSTISNDLKDTTSSDDLPYILDRQPEVFVVTAASFKAVWADADFHNENRRMREFNVDERRRTFVDTLYSLPKQRHIAHLHKLRATMLLLPLKYSRVKFMVILPDRINGLHQMEKELEFVDLRSLLGVKMDHGRYDVRLPVMNIVTNIELADNLGFLGIRKVFNPKQADLSRITGQKQRLRVRRFPHLTHFELNEQGINFRNFEIQTRVRHDGETHNHFYASHPFFFALVDEYKVYATGRYGQLTVDPDDIKGKGMRSSS
ncbi:ovalbumin-like [Drosophila rhopaloa]|uniref:Ovalbumin-like n=1 Tax=Drosophila rhopaloa TaxID=1041015 RepID=A0A6P4EAV6_DRORH|nr:ovalbumin-like [Drosophila rhopaloa]